MPVYRVRWEIDIEAEDHVRAAEAALRVQREAGGSATVFDVRGGGRRMRVDLGGDGFDAESFEVPHDGCSICGDGWGCGGEGG